MAEEPEDCGFVPAEVPVPPGDAEDRFAREKECPFRHRVDGNRYAGKEREHIGQAAENSPCIRDCRRGHFHGYERVDLLFLQDFLGADKIDVRAAPLFNRLVADGIEHAHRMLLVRDIFTFNGWLMAL